MKQEEKTNIKSESNIKPKIINLSAHNFNKDQIHLLKLGLMFCPISKSNVGELKKNHKEFESKFRLIEKFKNKRDTDDSQVKIKTKFLPDKDNNSELTLRSYGIST